MLATAVEAGGAGALECKYEYAPNAANAPITTTPITTAKPPHALLDVFAVIARCCNGVEVARVTGGG